jgi:hypothetical protein
MKLALPSSGFAQELANSIVVFRAPYRAPARAAFGGFSFHVFRIQIGSGLYELSHCRFIAAESRYD